MQIDPPSSVAYATNCLQFSSPRGEALFKIPFVFHNKDSEREFENLFVLINYLYLRIPLFLKGLLPLEIMIRYVLAFLNFVRYARTA